VARPVSTSSTQTVTLASLFDAQRPPADELLRECVHCGFCLPACPTYMLWREEMDSPRGRIYLMQMAASGNAEAIDRNFVEHFDRCLGCMSCMSACPSGVQYDKLIEATRAQIERLHRRPFWDRVYRDVIFLAFPHPGRLRALALPLTLYQRLGIRALVERSGLLKLLPKRLQAMHDLLPEIRSEKDVCPEHVMAHGAPRRRVGVVLGCVQRVFFPGVNSATIRVLAAEGCEVFAPKLQGCCGALATHVGREEESREAARRMIDTFEKLNVDEIAINAAGCGSNLKSYGHLLRDDPQYADKASAFAAKCKDVSEILAALKPVAERHSLKVRAAYQDSCHLLHAQGVRLQPRSLLRGIPGLGLVDLPESHVCCGSAGVYNLLEPETARQLGERKAANVVRTKADVLVSGNPGCLLQMTKELRRMGIDIPAYHYIEVLDASIRGRELPR
jgi:glycolate dehydrogenase iron-sulfur subunit